MIIGVGGVGGRSRCSLPSPAAFVQLHALLYSTSLHVYALYMHLYALITVLCPTPCTAILLYCLLYGTDYCTFIQLNALLYCYAAYCTALLSNLMHCYTLLSIALHTVHWNYRT